jgi:hypothetical protein
MPTKKQESHYLSEAYEYFKVFKSLLSSSCFRGPNRPTNRTTSYRVYIASCSVKRKRSGFLLFSPSLFQGERSNRLSGLWTPLFLNCYRPVTPRMTPPKVC